MFIINLINLIFSTAENNLFNVQGLLWKNHNCNLIFLKKKLC